MLLTENPDTKLSAKRIINALITNKNSPKVTIVIGNVKMTSNGLTNTFNTAKVRATKTAVE